MLCCLTQKRAVLAECRRVIRHGGRMAFSVIYIAEGLSSRDHAEAADTAPEFTETDASYPELIAATGWAIRARHDLTDAFAANCREKLRAEQALRADLEPLSSPAEFDAAHARMQRRIAALERCHLRRELFVVDPAT